MHVSYNLWHCWLIISGLFAFLQIVHKSWFHIKFCFLLWLLIRIYYGRCFLFSKCCTRYFLVVHLPRCIWCPMSAVFRLSYFFKIKKKFALVLHCLWSVSFWIIRNVQIFSKHLTTHESFLYSLGVVGDEIKYTSNAKERRQIFCQQTLHKGGVADILLANITWRRSGRYSAQKHYMKEWQIHCCSVGTVYMPLSFIKWNFFSYKYYVHISISLFPISKPKFVLLLWF